MLWSITLWSQCSGPLHSGQGHSALVRYTLVGVTVLWSISLWSQCSGPLHSGQGQSALVHYTLVRVTVLWSITLRSSTAILLWFLTESRLFKAFITITIDSLLSMVLLYHCYTFLHNHFQKQYCRVRHTHLDFVIFVRSFLSVAL